MMMMGILDFSLRGCFEGCLRALDVEERAFLTVGVVVRF